MIKPPQGYYILAVGEITEEGDLYYADGWYEIIVRLMVLMKDYGHCARKIKPLQGYRILSVSDIIEDGDLYHSDSGWRSTYDAGRKIDSFDVGKYARKIT